MRIARYGLETDAGQAFQRAMCSDLNATVEAAYPSFRVNKKRADEEEQDIRTKWDANLASRILHQNLSVAWL